MKNKTNHERIKKITHILRIFMQICFWGLIAAAVITVIITLILILIPDAYSFFITPRKNSTLGIELYDMLRYKFNSDLDMSIKMKPAFYALIIRTSICSLIMAPFFYQLSHILKSTEKDKPFEVNNARRLTIMGILLIVYSFVFRIGEYVMLQSTLHALDIPNMTINYTFNTNGLFMGLLLFILAGIFRYGSHLQEEYDTTL